MEREYQAYSCPVCENTTIFLSREVDTTLRKGKTVRCGHCGCDHLYEVHPFDDLEECMNERFYERIHGRLRQQI